MTAEADLQRAQERLAHTLERARASEDRELMNRVRDEGFQLVHLFNGVLRMGHLHSLDNRAFDAPVRDLARALGRLCDLLGTLAPAAERLEGTAAAVAISIIKGANIIRVHDVKEMVKVASGR